MGRGVGSKQALQFVQQVKEVLVRYCPIDCKKRANKSAKEFLHWCQTNKRLHETNTSKQVQTSKESLLSIKVELIDPWESPSARIDYGKCRVLEWTSLFPFLSCVEERKQEAILRWTFAN